MNTMKHIRSRFIKNMRTGCLVWPGATCTTGYGQVSFQGKHKLVHRLIWETKHGPIPADRQIDHLCRVRRCGNIRHMELVTPEENVTRGCVARWYGKKALEKRIKMGLKKK